MEPKARPLDVVFALHDQSGNYWLNTAVALSSVAMYATVPLRFHVLTDETFTSEADTRLNAIAKYWQVGLSVKKLSVGSEIKSIKYHQFSLASIYRLTIPSLFCEHDEVVYLDSDLVANGLDIAEIVRAGSHSLAVQAPLCAVIDRYIAVPQGHRRELDRLGLDAGLYVNSGVLLVRPSKFKEDLLERFVEHNRCVGPTIHPDQDFINCLFLGRFGYLDARFNFQANLINQSLLRPLEYYQGKIIHYAGALKPLDGYLAPGFLPFWMHAALIPEISKFAFNNKSLTYLQNHPLDINAVNLIKTSLSHE